jgi:hypothetical protein
VNSTASAHYRSEATLDSNDPEKCLSVSEFMSAVKRRPISNTEDSENQEDRTVLINKIWAVCWILKSYMTSGWTVSLLHRNSLTFVTYLQPLQEIPTPNLILLGVKTGVRPFSPTMKVTMRRTKNKTLFECKSWVAKSEAWRGNVCGLLYILYIAAVKI